MENKKKTRNAITKLFRLDANTISGYFPGKKNASTWHLKIILLEKLLQSKSALYFQGLWSHYHNIMVARWRWRTWVGTNEMWFEIWKKNDSNGESGQTNHTRVIDEGYQMVMKFLISL